MTQDDRMEIEIDREISRRRAEALTITDPAEIRASDDPDEGATVPPGLDLAAIKDTAKRAAFGWGAEWRDERVPEGPDCEWFTVHADGKRDMVGSEDGDVARHIAGMDPAATLALVARVEAAEAKVAAVEARVGEWESDRDVCLAWIADPAMHADEGHPDRLSRVADSLDRHARAMRAALATTGEGQ